MRWLAAGAILSILLYLWLREADAPISAREPRPESTAPASAPVAVVMPPEPAKIATPLPSSAPSLTSGFCDPPGEDRISRTLKRDEATALRKGFALLHTATFADAAPIFDRYLSSHPDDAQIARVRSRLRAQIDVQDGFAVTTVDSVTLAYPADTMNSNDAWSLGDRIDDALYEAARLTGTERRGPLYAVAYRDRSELLAVTCVPSWAVGVYDGTLRLALDNMQTDAAKDRELRHEAMHAQLSTVVRSAPRWFEEGLAQYFEQHGKLRWSGAFDVMLKNKTYIPFRSLEGSFFVFEGNNDAALAYEQSLAMIHLLVDRNGEAVIARAVELLKKSDAKLLEALDPTLTEADLLTLLERKQPR